MWSEIPNVRYGRLDRTSVATAYGLYVGGIAPRWVCFSIPLAGGRARQTFESEDRLPLPTSRQDLRSKPKYKAIK